MKDQAWFSSLKEHEIKYIGWGFAALSFAVAVSIYCSSVRHVHI